MRSLNAYPKLVDEMLEGNPNLTTDAEPDDAAIPILDRLYSRELKAAIALYDQFQPRRALCTEARVLGARSDELSDREPLAAILRYEFH